MEGGKGEAIFFPLATCYFPFHIAWLENRPNTVDNTINLGGSL